MGTYKSRHHVQFRMVKLFFIVVLFLSPCVVASVFGQSKQQLEFHAERIKFGEIEVKRNTLYELRNFESEAASRVALPALNDVSEIVRATAARTVVYLPKAESLKALLPLLDEKSEFVRREAVYALGETRNVGAVSQLITHLQTDKKRVVRTACAFALGKIGSVSAISSLTSILNKKPKKKWRFLRRAAARSIGEIAQIAQTRSLTVTTPESFLPEKYKEIVKPKYRSLAHALPVFFDANTSLIQILKNEKDVNDTKREAAFALGEIGEKVSISILRSNLSSTDYYLAEICKEALRKIDA